MKIHPLANLFPDMSKEDFATLVADIKENGLLDPISTYEDSIIDGKHRFKACAVTKTEPKFIEYTGDEPLRYVISRNLSRRHLEIRDKAFVAAEIEGLKPGTNQWDMVGRQRPTTAELAKILGVSERSIKAARTILETGSAKLIAEVRAGDMPLSYASLIAKLKKSEQSDPRKRKAIIAKARKKKNPNKEAPLNSFAWANANMALRQKWIGDVGVKSIWEAMTDDQKEALLDLAEAEQAESDRILAAVAS